MWTLEKADFCLKIFMGVLFSPLLGIFWLKLDTGDFLTYLSFVLSISGAIYAGRGVFSSENQPDNDSNPKRFFFVSLFLIFCAALCLLPVLYKKYPVVLVCSMVSLILILSIAAIVSILKGYLKDNKHPFLRGLLPIQLIVFDVVVIVYTTSNYELLTK